MPDKAPTKITATINTETNTIRLDGVQEPADIMAIRSKVIELLEQLGIPAFQGEVVIAVTGEQFTEQPGDQQDRYGIQA